MGTLLCASAATGAQDVSQIKLGVQGAETSTSSAHSYFTNPVTFPDQTTSTREFWGSATEINRPAELKELARALRNDVDLIYEYVHDNVRTTFMYGLQKGALGALLDQSGTPFDQAHLMVELLREAGYSARFKSGTLLLSAAQANAWLGTSNSNAIRKTFRDGGIPLDYSSTGPTYTIGHIWVEVTIPGASCGSACWFDPSYKTHAFKSPLSNLESLMGWSANEFNAADVNSFLYRSWIGLTTQSPLADPVWISGINHTNLENKLQGYATSLLTNLKSVTHSAKEIDDVIGGQEIVKTGTTPIRSNGSLVGFTTEAAIVQRTWDCVDATHCGIPDPYRTTFTVKLVHALGAPTGTVYMNKKFFVDEIYGRRLMFDTPLNAYTPDTGGPGSYEHFCFQLALDGVPIPTTPTQPTELGCTGVKNVPFGRTYYVDLAVDHPYAAGSGVYMDLSSANGTHIRKRADFLTPVAIIHGWGDVSPALVSKLSSEQSADRLLPVVDPDPGGGGYEPGEMKSDSAMDHTMVKMGASYLAQYSRMAEVQKRLGNAQHAMHHMVGLVYTEVDPQNGWALNPNPPSTDNEWLIRDRGIRINLDGAISVNSNSDVTADRQKVIHATLAAAAALEGSIFEQMMDTPFTGSTATRFRWGSANISGLKYYLFRPNSPTPPPPNNWLGSDFGAAGCTPIEHTPAVIPDYVNASKGFWAIAAAEKCLGPGNKYGPPDGAGAFILSMQRGPAFVAFLPDSNSVAHVVGYSSHNSYSGQWFKGGGAGAAPEYAREFDAAGAASLLKDKFEDRSRLHGVDLQSGELTYSAPADLRLGEGGFPYELSFQRTFKPGASASVGLPDGWAHNLDVRAAFSGDGLAKMGMDSAQAAAETIAAAYTLQKIYSVAPTLDASTPTTDLRDHLKRWVLGPFVMDWWSSKLSHNVVTINAGHDARQFTRFADGFFYPPRNGVGTLTQNGQRVLHEDETANFPEPVYDRWDYSPVSFTYTSPEKDVQTFAYYEYDNGGPLALPTENVSGRKHGWHLTSWVFPYGATLTYTYGLSIGGAGVSAYDRLLSLSNNLGRTLTLNYAQSPDSDAPLLTSLTDGQGRTVSFSQPASSYMDRVLTQVTLPEAGNGAEIAKYSYVGDGENPPAIPAGARPQLHPKLWKVFAPSDATNAKIQVDYDRTWRVKEYRDAVAILTPTQRGPWSFYVTGTSRGERVDPLGGQYKAYYDSRGHAYQLIDEENRAVSQTFDNHDRVKERTFPEGNKVQFVYDDVTHNIKTLTQLRKSSAYWTGSDGDIVVQATYDTNCARIKTVTDAKGKITTWTYNSTTCTLTNIVQPPVPNPEAGGAMTPPTTAFLYNGFGQVTKITDPTNRVVDIEYDPTTRYRLRRRVNQAGLNLTTTYGHNAYGDISSVDGPRSDVTDVTAYTYDKMRRLKQIDAPLCAKTKNVMDLDGDVYRVERAKDCTPTWQVWQKTFTPTKKVATETSPTGAISAYSYDALDRTSVVQDPDSRKVFTDYFKDGETKQVVKGYQSTTMAPIEYVTYTYTPNGQIDLVEDANGNFTNLDYDAFDRLHRTFHADPATGAACAPGIPHSTSAPSCGANQKYEQLGYDANGNVTSKRNRSGQSLTFVFDDLNRETTRNVPSNLQAHFQRTLTTSYDLASRKYDVTVVESPLTNQTLSHRYDAAGRVDYVDDSFLGGTNRLDHSYDAADNRTSVAYPGGTTVSYTFDALNRMDTVTEGGLVLADYDWDTLSRRDLVKLNANAFNMDLAYEADDDLLQLVHTGPAPLTFDFTRNNSGQITNLTASNGNFLSRPVNTVATGYVPNRLNQYASVGGTAYSHDANGNLTGDGVYSYEYDEENRLRSAVGGGFTTSYEYDPLGRRRAKTVNGTLTKFVSDNAEEIEERNSSNAVLRRYVYGSGIDERIAMIEVATPSNCPGTGGRCFYLTNWQGSATTLVNQNGSLNATYHYGPYGEGTNWSPADALTGNPFRYTGRRVDAETGLYYYRARYYSPKLGRFLQTDPIGTDEDPNVYAYTYNDAANNTDPSGECPWCIGALVGAGLELVAQSVEIAVGARTEYSGKDVAIAAVAGATGVQAARLISRAGDIGRLTRFVANRTADAAVSAGSQLAKDGDVSLNQVATDVSVGALVGDSFGNRAGAAATGSPEGKLLERTANRTERVAAQSSRQGRQDSARDARARQRDHVASAEARSSQAASSVVSRTIEAGKCIQDKSLCE